MQAVVVAQQTQEHQALEEVVSVVPVQKIVQVHQELMEQSVPDQVVVVELLLLEIQDRVVVALLLFATIPRQQPV
jgi:hypothetical protein